MLFLQWYESFDPLHLQAEIPDPVFKLGDVMECLTGLTADELKQNCRFAVVNLHPEGFECTKQDSEFGQGTVEVSYGV